MKTGSAPGVPSPGAVLLDPGRNVADAGHTAWRFDAACLPRSLTTS